MAKSSFEKGADRAGKKFVKGADKLTKKLSKAAKDLGKKASKDVTVKLAQETVKTAKGAAPKRKGHLKKSLSYVVRQAKKFKGVLAVVGPRVGEVAERAGKNGKSKRVWKAAKKGVNLTKGTVKPHKYAHLVEEGHGGKHAARPHPFLRPSWEKVRPTAVGSATRFSWQLIRRALGV